MIPKFVVTQTFQYVEAPKDSAEDMDSTTADVIAWWRQVWKDVGVTPAHTAGRIRRYAATVLGM